MIFFYLLLLKLDNISKKLMNKTILQLKFDNDNSYNIKYKVERIYNRIVYAPKHKHNYLLCFD